MNYEMANLLLLEHGSGWQDGEGEIHFKRDGFLGMLRPYQGLIESNFHRVLEAIYVVGERVCQESQMDRELAGTLFHLCTTARSWGLRSGGMLQRNKLITAADTDLLENWIDTFETTISMILAGHPPFFRVSTYAEYVIQYGTGDNEEFFISQMIRHLELPDEIVDQTEVALALGKLGNRASEALPALRDASKRQFASWCHADAQHAIATAIAKIEQAP